MCYHPVNFLWGHRKLEKYDCFKFPHYCQNSNSKPKCLHSECDISVAVFSHHISKRFSGRFPFTTREASFVLVDLICEFRMACVSLCKQTESSTEHTAGALATHLLQHTQNSQTNTEPRPWHSTGLVWGQCKRPGRSKKMSWLYNTSRERLAEGLCLCYRQGQLRRMPTTTNFSDCVQETAK